MTALRLTRGAHQELKDTLFRDHNRESAAILLCQESHSGDLYLARTVVPATTITSSLRHVSWSGDSLRQAQDTAEVDGLTMILSHSHPTGMLEFSTVDDESDRLTIPLIFEGWLGHRAPLHHGSLIMTPNGEMQGRLYDRKGNTNIVNRISIVGDTVRIFDNDQLQGVGEFETPIAFGRSMTAQLRRMKATVIGISGTGSVVAEQLIRLGVGHVCLVDFDVVEPKNLNRILNSTAEDAEERVPKSNMMANIGRRFGSPSTIESIPSSILDRRAILASATSDFLFCCVDSLDAREMCDSLSAAFLLPLIDVGVTVLTRLDDAGQRQVADVLGRVDFVRPGGPSLFDRGVYSAASLRHEYLRRNAPHAYASEVAEGYVKGVVDEAPPVISINMKAASTAVLEMIGRLCPFRHDRNASYARTILRMAEGEEEHIEEGEFSTTNQPLFARGDAEPLLNMPALAKTG